MKNKKIFIITLLILLLLSSVIAYASGEYNGYIVKMPETKGLRLMSAMPEDAEYYGNGIYVVETYEEAKKLSRYAEYIEPNHIVYLYDTYDYSGLLNNNYFLNAVNILPVWNYGFYGDDILVGVIDSGCNPHPLINGALVEGHNFFDETTDVTDTLGHGTTVSGFIAARYGNTETIGMAHHAKIMPLKAFQNGQNTYAADLCPVIRYATDNGCKIINMSLGSPGFTQALKEAIDYAVSQGVIVVAAVGNDAQADNNPNYLSYPAALDNVIGVGAINSKFKRAPFSHHNESVFIVAPGSRVRGISNSGGYITTDGTSISTPIVSGIIADMMSINKNITLDEIKDILIKTSNREYGFAEGEIRNDNYGYGIIDAGAIAEHMLFLKSKIVEETIAEELDDTLPVEDKAVTFFARMEDVDKIEPQEFGVYFFASDEEIDEDKVKTYGEVYKANGKLSNGSYSVRLINGEGKTDYFNKNNIGIISYLKINDEIKFGLLQFIK